MIKSIQQPVQELKTQIGNGKGIGVGVEKGYRQAALPFLTNSSLLGFKQGMQGKTRFRLFALTKTAADR